MTWIVGGGVATGTMHVATGIKCQDACAYLAQGDTLFACIADGAGTAPLSHMGSTFVTQEFLQLCSRQFLYKMYVQKEARNWLNEAIKALHYGLLREAHTLAVPISHLATTFTACIATPSYIVAAQIGDGFLVGGGHASFNLLLWEEHKEFINETHFLTDKSYKARILSTSAYDFLALGTDGVSSVAIDPYQKIAHEGFFSPFQEYLSTQPFEDELEGELKKFLNSERLNKKTEDDKTLLVALYKED